MSIFKYSVLKGSPKSGSLSKDSRPHYLIELDINGTNWEIAVNVESDTGSGTNAEVLYSINESWTPPDGTDLNALPLGITQLAGKNGPPAIDYVRSLVNGQPMITQAAMQKLPLPGQSSSSNLKNAVIALLNEAVADKQGTIYAFGSQYTSGNGIHDIHMNQGNPTNDHASDNGVWQDGLLVFSMPNSSKLAAVFLAFQDESWSTDTSGNPT